MSMPLHFLSTLYMQATLAVYTSGSTGLPEGDSVSFPWYFTEINVNNPALAAPSGYNVCLRVGGLDGKRAGRSFFLGRLRTFVFEDHQRVCLVQVAVGLVA